MDACSSHGLREMVGQPTRGDYLLDLVLCSHADVKVQLGAMLADHASLLIKVPDAVETRILAPRLVWQYEDADWHAIKFQLDHCDWHILTQGSVDDALAQFVSVLESLMHAHIPRKLKRMQKSSLPWLNDICFQAINVKHEAELTVDYNDVAKHCRQVLLGERQKYMAQLRKKSKVSHGLPNAVEP